MKKLLLLSSLFVLFATQLYAQHPTNHMLPNAQGFLNSKPFQNWDKVIELFPGDTMRFVVATQDTITDSVYVKSNIASVLPSATFAVTNAQQQTGYIVWAPSAADVSLALDSFLISIEDNGYPIKGMTSSYIKIRVNKPGSITLNNGLVNLNQDIELEPGTSMNLRFSSVNPALANAFTITSNVASALSGATFTTDNAIQQTANINFTPTAAQVNSQPYTFTVTYQDNAPVPNQYVYTVNVKVRNAGMLGTSKEVSELTSFSAFPNPFTDAVNFKIASGSKAKTILIYNLLGQEVDRILVISATPENREITWTKARNYPGGTYIAKLISADKTVQTLKFIKLQ